MLTSAELARSSKIVTKANNLVLNGVMGLAGAAITITWLTAWAVLDNAAQWYSLAMASWAVVCYAVAFRVETGWAKKALHISSFLAQLLALSAAFSLGAFLPFTWADFVSPALGRFGGFGGLLVLAGLNLVATIKQRRAISLHLFIFSFASAIWVAINTAAQASFPPPPTSKNQWALLLGALFGLALLNILGMLVAFASQQKWAIRVCGQWALVCGLASSSLATFFQQLPPIAWLFSLFFAVMLIACLIFALRPKAKTAKRTLAWLFVKQIGAIMLLTLSIAIGYLAVSEQLEVVLLRDTAERYAQKFWWATIGDQRFDYTVVSGSISGYVHDLQGKPLADAKVIVAYPTGATVVATSDNNGFYILHNVKAGSYLPMAAHVGYADAAANGSFFGLNWRMVATVRNNEETSQVNFAMQPQAMYQAQTNHSLQLGTATVATRQIPTFSQAIRRSFTFQNDGLTLKGGIVYEPTAEHKGPFPVLLVIYPGPAEAWEGISVPLAAQGYVVVAYQPQRGLDLGGDERDLQQLYNYIRAGQFSTRGNAQKIVLVGGSVSTAYVYLLLRDLENAAPSDKNAIKGAIMYGGLTDIYHYRLDWERGALYIDPGIQPLEGLLIALGRPDLRPEIYLHLSSLYHLGAESLPPLLLIHAERDSIVPVNQTQNLTQALTSNNIANKVIIYPNIDHYLDTSKADPSQLDMLNQTMSFLTQVMKP